MSQSFSTLYGNQILAHGSEVVIGTAMLGADFGTIKIARLKRSGEVVSFDDGGGGLRGLIITQPGVELELECAFDLTVQPPGHLDRITLPVIGLVGRVMPGVEISWEQGKERGLSIPVNQWDSLVNAQAWRVNPITGVATSLDVNAATAATCDSTSVTCDSTALTCDAA